MTVDQLVNLSSDDRYAAACERIRHTDLLIVDEISMLSKCMFEKLEGIMRSIRGTNSVFGG